MLDIKLIRSNPNLVKEGIKKREINLDKEIDEILELDLNRRQLIGEVESKKAEKNKFGKQIPILKRQGQDISAIMATMKELSEAIKKLDIKCSELIDKQQNLLLGLPNLPAKEVEAGGKDKNKILSYFKEKPKFNFKPKDHVELCESLNIINYKMGAKIAGSGSWVYTGIGAKLEWALINFFIDEHIADGYEFILPPHMLNYNCGHTAGQFPKFKDEVYWIENPTSSTKKFLLPTAETALVNLHAGDILEESSLPKKYIAYTPCYRREAGSYRSEERGMIRGHQFNKVEMVQYTTPGGSDSAFNELVSKAQRLVEKLGLHYRLSKLAAGDCSYSMAKTYDIEIYIPSMSIYKEVSSASNAMDYQARRGNIKYRNSDKKLEFVHTLNASGLATSRLIPAIVEQYQNEDGSVTVPEVLINYIGIDKITK